MYKLSAKLLDDIHAQDTLHLVSMYKLSDARREFYSSKNKLHLVSKINLNCKKWVIHSRFIIIEEG